MIDKIKLSVATVFVFCLTLSCLVFPKFASGESNAIASKRIYQQHCARCHGADGKANTESGRLYEVPDLTASRPSFSRIVSIVKNGEGQMPRYSKKLTTKEIASVSKYVRLLK
jgi:mono/diheme cytochrome c family protein